MAKHYDEAKVVRSLLRKPGVNLTRAFDGTRVLQITYDNEFIGIRSWGKIDFLTKHCGYILQRVDKIHGKVIRRESNDDVQVKGSKRDKLNIANMVKNSMKNIKRM